MLAHLMLSVKAPALNEMFDTMSVLRDLHTRVRLQVEMRLGSMASILALGYCSTCIIGVRAYVKPQVHLLVCAISTANSSK